MFGFKKFNKTLENPILNGLNEAQKEAVTTTEGYVRVIAGAGSGKTRAIASRYAYLVNHLGVPQDSILCVTFTNKAAGEMKRRIQNLLGEESCGMICTFHSFCVKLLKEDIHHLNYPRNFMILDGQDSKDLMKTCFERFGLTIRDMSYNSALDYIAEKKHLTPYVRLLTSQDISQIELLRDSAETIKDKLFYQFLLEQRKSFALDFTDLILFALHILENSDDVRKKWQERIQYIMVDEFQDVNLSQYCLTRILAEHYENLFVVGDPDQTIYTWRGARVEFIMDFERNFPNAKTIFMQENYRSTNSVLSASNALIKKNKTRIDKNLLPMRDVPGKAIYFHANNEGEQVSWIITQIQSLLEQGVKAPDICILYRAHYLSRAIEEGLVVNHIPYTIYNGFAFYSRKEVKDVLSYLRFVQNRDDVSFRRIINEPARHFGKKKMSAVEEYAEEHNCSLYQALLEIHSVICPGSYVIPVAAFIEMVEKYSDRIDHEPITNILEGILKDSGYENMLMTQGDQERLDNLAELKQSIKLFEDSAGEPVSLSDYLEHIALISDADVKDHETIKIMTIHTAKGMEFPYVFVYELSEGVFPTARANTLPKMEEERRLAYVAFTRAQEYLFLTNSSGITINGNFRFPSRFVFNAEKANLEYVVQLPPDLEEDSAEYIINNEELLSKGESIIPNNTVVHHETLGVGVIVGFDESRKIYKIQFENFGSVRTLSINAPLTVLSK